MAVALAMAFSACSNDDDTDKTSNWAPATISLTNSEQTMVTGNNDFAFNLLRATAKARQGESFVISPLSMTHALTLIENGAGGTTKSELLSMMGFYGMDDADINAFCQKMIDQITSIDKTTTVNTANILLVNNTITLNTDHTSKLSTYFKAEATSMDFSQEDKVVSYVNNWASQHTNGMIPEMLKQISPSAQLLLMNAVYFKGTWYAKFDKNRTYEAPFAREDGSMTNVKYMTQEQNLSYTETDNCQMIVLPYGNGSYRMVVMLPKTDETVADVINSLTAETFQNTWKQVQTEDIIVKFPKFTTEFDQSYKDIITELGAGTMFSNIANLSGISNASLKLTSIDQKAKIIVDEEGTEAAAVTKADFTFTSIGGEKPYRVFTADHPFVYAIVESSTLTPFFLGVYTGN